MRRVLLVTAALGALLSWALASGQSVVPTELEVSCDKGICTLKESDLDALIKSNNAAARAALRCNAKYREA